MNIPIEIVVVFLGSILALQGWILAEVVSLKVKLEHVKDLERRVKRLEDKENEA